MVDTENQPAVANGASKGDSVEMSPLDRKIIRQIEHYFGDYNLPKDKFLQEAVKENDGWVDMETLLKFKRLADLSKEPEVILAAIRKSKSGLMEVEGEGAKGRLRRSPSQPVPDNSEESRLEVQARTAYAKGYDKEKTTLDELLEYYMDHEPAVINIQMRYYVDKKDKSRHFKGSVFMTFRDLESCKKFVEAETMQYKEAPLLRKFQKDYLEEKNKEFEERRKGRNANKKDAMHQDKVKKVGDKDIKEEEEQEKEISLPLGTVLKLEGLGGDITREDLKEVLANQFNVKVDRDGGDIAFITYERGGADAKIRFRTENFAKPIVEQWKGKDKVLVKDMEVKASLMEGEEEKQFLADSMKDLQNFKNRNKNNFKAGHKRKNSGKGGSQYKRSRN